MLFNFKGKSNFRNNTHMTNFQAQPHRPPLSRYIQNFSTPLTLEVQFQTEISRNFFYL